MRRPFLQDYAAWLQVLIGSVCLGLAGLLLQLSARSRREPYDLDPRLGLSAGLFAGVIPLVFGTRPKRRSTVKSP